MRGPSRDAESIVPDAAKNLVMVFLAVPEGDVSTIVGIAPIPLVSSGSGPLRIHIALTKPSIDMIGRADDITHQRNLPTPFQGVFLINRDSIQPDNERLKMRN